MAVWIYEGELRLEYEQTVLAHYEAIYDRQRKQLQRIEKPLLYRTPFASPQLEIWELDESQWLKVRERPLMARRIRPREVQAEQLALVGLSWVLLGIRSVTLHGGTV